MPPQILSHRAAPVSVLVKNHTRAPTTAPMAMTNQPIGLARKAAVIFHMALDARLVAMVAALVASAYTPMASATPVRANATGVSTAFHRSIQSVTAMIALTMPVMPLAIASVAGPIMGAILSISGMNASPSVTLRRSLACFH